MKYLLRVAVCVTGLASVNLAFAQPNDQAPPGVYELRTYTTEPGKLSALHERFRDHTMKLFEKHGIKNVIYWTPVDMPDTLVYLLAHESEEAGKAAFTAFRNDPEWQKVYAESRKDGPLVKNVSSLYLKPTDYSPTKPLPVVVQNTPGMVYELRTYTTEAGKLPDLHARFCDHTMKLFEKHGMTNLLYATPVDEKLKNNTLVYVLAHKSLDEARQSWKAFLSDPQWRRVAEQSQREGPILVKGGVRRLYLKPTDFSPVQ